MNDIRNRNNKPISKPKSFYNSSLSQSPPSSNNRIAEISSTDESEIEILEPRPRSNNVNVAKLIQNSDDTITIQCVADGTIQWTITISAKLSSTSYQYTTPNNNLPIIGHIDAQSVLDSVDQMLNHKQNMSFERLLR